jgi:salicylate hydroxylase
VSEQLQVAIVGGGIGGLSAALALRARGLNVTIFEQVAELREIGAGVSIHANAALLLQRIGLTDSIKKIGVPIAGLLLRTSAGEPIDISTQPSSGIQAYNVHRAEFQRLLADAPSNNTASVKPSSIACAAPWPRCGTIGWAASPSRVIRPVDQYGRRARS